MPSAPFPGEPIANLVEEILSSYQSLPQIRHIDAGRLPNRAVIIDMIHQFRELLLPGYFGKQNLDSHTLSYHIGELIVALRGKLLEQIFLALVHRQAKSSADASDARHNAAEIVSRFLSRLSGIRRVLATDVQAAFEGDPAAADTDEIIFSYPGFLAISVYRLAHELWTLGVPLIPRIMSEYAHSLTGIDIHPGATIGEYFFIDHGTGVVIGETTHIGQRVKIYQGVTLGAISTRGGQRLRGLKRHPTLDDEVTVYSGASILGGETVIGRGVVISSNVFVTQSVPQLTRVTVRNPELQYRDQQPREFKQELPADWVI